MIEVKNISKTFGTKKVLDEVSFLLKDGEILSIVGPSGGGKTTLLRCISGLEEKDSGEVWIDGKLVNLTQNKNEQTQIGVVFQDFNLFPHLSVLENLALAPKIVLKEEKTRIHDEALNLLKNLELKEKANQYPYELSGGQKQRVAIARALMMKPKVLCYDEPTSALDPELRDNVAQTLLALKEQGMTQIVVTHDHKLAKSIADQVIEVEAIS